jgi:3',5'-cyclic AMP phosphodiesterase CpdA
MILFAHISDLHFGKVLANNGAGAVPHQWPHSLQLCRALPAALADARVVAKAGRDAIVRVVVSGDLTVSGSASEFAVAHSYLRSRPRLRRLKVGGFMGLGMSDEDLLTVPGNHDHWGGNRLWPMVPAYSAAIFPSHFRDTPFLKRWTSADGSVELELYGVDSNSGLANQAHNVAARGEISSRELRELERRLAASSQQRRSQRVVRAIVCHHSLLYTGGKAGTRDLDPQSRKTLLELAGKYGVSAILTGHTHDLHWAGIRTMDANQRVRDVVEYRSGATLPFKQKQNGFWLHKIDRTSSGCFWFAWRYAWNGVRFVRTPAQASNTQPV